MSREWTCSEASELLRALHEMHNSRLSEFLLGGCDPPQPVDLMQAAVANHYFNCRLWREEDLARRTNVPDAQIVANKRAIDRFNQARNDATERFDEHLLRALPPLNTQTRLNSETPGSMVDRLSIMSLKAHHMGLQANRAEAGESLRRECREKLSRLRKQRRDLSSCLQSLLRECLEGSAHYRQYRQFKMYNDPRYRTYGDACPTRIAIESR